MSTTVRAEIYTLQVSESEAAVRYVVLMKIRLGIRSFVGLVREEAYDQTCGLPATEAAAIIAGETMVWAEEMDGGPEPISPAVSRVLEDCFQERLLCWLEGHQQYLEMA